MLAYVGSSVPAVNDYITWLESNSEDRLFAAHIAALKGLASYAVGKYGENSSLAGWCKWYQYSTECLLRPVLEDFDQMIACQEKAVKKEKTKEAQALLCIMRLDRAVAISNECNIDDPSYYPEVLKAEHEGVALYPDFQNVTDYTQALLYFSAGQAYSTFTDGDVLKMASADYDPIDAVQYFVQADGSFSPAFFYMEVARDAFARILNPGHPLTLLCNKNMADYALNQFNGDMGLTSEYQRLQDYFRSYEPLNSFNYLINTFALWTAKFAYREQCDDFSLWEYRISAFKDIVGHDSDVLGNILFGLMYPATLFAPADLSKLMDEYDNFNIIHYSDQPIKLALSKFFYHNFKDIAPERSLKNVNEAFDLYIQYHDRSPQSMYLGKQGAIMAYNSLYNISQAEALQKVLLEDLTAIYGPKASVVFNSRNFYATIATTQNPAKAYDLFPPLISDMEKAGENPSPMILTYSNVLTYIPDFKGAASQLKRALRYSESNEAQLQAQIYLSLVAAMDNANDPSGDKEKYFKKGCEKLHEVTDSALMNPESYLIASYHLENTGQFHKILDFVEEGLEVCAAQGLPTTDRNFLNLKVMKYQTLCYHLNQPRLATQLMMQEIEDIKNSNILYYNTDVLNFLWECFKIANENNSNDLTVKGYFLSFIYQYTQSLYLTSGEDNPVFFCEFMLPLIGEVITWHDFMASSFTQEEMDNSFLTAEGQKAVKNQMSNFSAMIDNCLDMMKKYADKYAAEGEASGVSKKAMADISYILGNYYKARYNYKQAEQNYQYYLASLSPEFPSYDSAALLYDLYAEEGNLEKMGKEIPKIESLYDHPSFSAAVKLALISKLSAYYFQTKRPSKQLPYAKKYYAQVKQLFDSNLGLMSQKEQDNIMNRFGDPAGALISLLNSLPEESAGDAYNALLYRTGLQLRSQQDTKKAISKINTPQIRALQDSLIALQSLDKTLVNFNERGENDQATYNKKIQLNFDILRVEQQLLQETEKYRSEQMPDISWQDIRNKLKPDEAAVEIVFSVSTATALVLKSTSDKPLVVPLCEADSLTKLLESYGTKQPHRLAFKLYGDKSRDILYSLLWQPLEPYLSDAQRVYLSVEGVLNYISFPAIKTSAGDYLFDHYDLCMLTSTASIARQEKPQTPTSALLLGALYYSDGQEHDDPFSAWATTAEASVSSGEDQRRSIDDFDQAERGGGDHFAYLQNTPAELHNVSEALKSKASSVSLIKTQADEQSFKQALQSKPQLLHLATHGFFLPTEMDAYKIPFFKRYMGSISNSMQRAGFALSKAEDAWCGAELDEANDGILTASEVAQLDLSDTQLVTISACESALGNFSYEGVYGLPRGFKQAGAKSLLVSLWSVSDASTSLLMSQFYKNWMGGQPMREAYRQAVSTVREQYPHPYYWASFQLLDAID